MSGLKIIQESDSREERGLVLKIGTGITLTKDADGIMKLTAPGVSDHGALTGLGDDDHSQYALADGSRGVDSAEAFAYLSASTEATVSGSFEDMKFTAEVYDNGSNFSTSLHKYVTPTTGVYIVKVQVRWTSNANGRRQVRIKLDGVLKSINSVKPDSSGETFQEVTYVGQIASGVDVKADLYQNSGIGLTYMGGDNFETHIQIARIS